jgi:hypothetical protein
MSHYTLALIFFSLLAGFGAGASLKTAAIKTLNGSLKEARWQLEQLRARERR